MKINSTQNYQRTSPSFKMKLIGEANLSTALFKTNFPHLVDRLDLALAKRDDIFVFKLSPSVLKLRESGGKFETKLSGAEDCIKKLEALANEPPYVQKPIKKKK